MSVKLKLNEGGKLVTPYNGNPEYGFVVLTSTETVIQNGWMQSKERSAIIRGTVAGLTGAFSEGQVLDGKIAVTECLEDNIPAQFSAQFNKEQTEEEQIAPFIKRAGKEGPVLVQGGKRILRFTEYDASGTKTDSRVQHDNQAEIIAHNAKQKSGEANLPS